MMLVLIQRFKTPMVQAIPLGALVTLNDQGTLGVVTGVFRPPPDSIGGVMIEVTVN